MSSVNNIRTAAIAADAFRSKMLRQERREKAAEDSIHKEVIREYNQSTEKDSQLVEQMTAGIRNALVKDVYVNKSGNLSELKEELAVLSAPGMEEIETLMLLIPDMEEKKEILEKFASELDDDKEDSDDKKADSLKEYAAKNCSGVADSYLSLCYLLEILSQREGRKRWQKYLEKMIKKLQTEHYNELFEYFSSDVTNDADTGPINTKTREALSKTKSGEVRFANVKQIIDFIEQYLENDFTQMLAFYLKAKAQSMIELGRKADNFENKAEYSEIRATEAKIFNLNSFYAQVTKWRLAMKNKAKYSEKDDSGKGNGDISGKNNAEDEEVINISEHDAKVLRAVLEFFEFGFVSDMSINSLSFKCISGSLNVRQQIKLICGLKIMLNKLPASLFNYDEKLVEDLKKSLNKLIVEKDKQADKTKTWIDNLFKEQHAKLRVSI